MEESAKRQKRAEEEPPHSFLSSHAHDALSASLGLSCMPDLIAVDCSPNLLGLVVGETPIGLPLFSDFVAPPTGTRVSFLDEKIAEKGLEESSVRALKGLFNLHSAAPLALWGVWNTRDRFRLPAELVEETAAILVLVPPSYSKGAEGSALTLFHCSRPDKTVKSEANQSSLLGHTFAASSGDGELTYDGPAPFAVIARVLQPEQPEQPEQSLQVLHALKNDKKQRLQMAAATLWDQFLLKRGIVCAFFHISEGTEKCEALFQQMLRTLAAEKGIDAGEYQVFTAEFTDGDRYAFLGPFFGFESLSIRFDSMFLSSSMHDEGVLSLTTDTLAVGILRKSFLLDPKVSFEKPTCELKNEWREVVKSCFVFCNMQMPLESARGFPWRSDSDVPSYLSSFDAFLVESFRDEQLRKSVLSQWDNVYPRYVFHPVYIETLRQFVAIDDGPQTQKLVFRAFVSWSECRGFVDTSDVNLTSYRQLGHSAGWFGDTLAFVNHHGMCPLFWTAVNSCVSAFSGYQPVLFDHHAISGNKPFAFSESIQPAVLAASAKCRVCLESMAKFIASLMMKYHTQPLPFTQETVEALGIRHELRETWPSIRDTLLLSERPITKDVSCNSRAKREVEPLAQRVNAALVQHGLGSARLAGSRMHWCVQVTITGTVSNRVAVNLWKEMTDSGQRFTWKLARLHGSLLRHESTRSLLLARWFTPHQMSFRSGLVPKEIWVHILKLVLASGSASPPAMILCA